MKQLGGDESGFSLNLRGSVVLVRVWGYWEAELAHQFAPAVLQLCRTVGKPFRMIIDGAALKPQGEDGQQAFRELVAGVIGLGLVRAAVIVKNSLTRIQLMRITKESAATNWVYIASEAADAGDRSSA
jgi:hypothetical protein